MELYNGQLNIQNIINIWTQDNIKKNYGAFIYFVGVVRDENSIDGLYFEIYKPILEKWFNQWTKYGLDNDINIKMAHSIGNVMINESSYISAIFSKHRKIGLSTINLLVEDFKKNAPIWKYEIIDSQRIYRREKSTPMNNNGLLI